MVCCENIWRKRKYKIIIKTSIISKSTEISDSESRRVDPSLLNSRPTVQHDGLYCTAVL